MKNVTSQTIEKIITDFIQTSPENTMKMDPDEPSWEEALVGYSSGSDPVFESFKEHVGEFHFTPEEIFNLEYPEKKAKAEELTVISWILPHREATHLISFADIAVKYLEQRGYEPHLCDSEDEARELAKTLPAQGKWPCLFTSSDTTGEKDFEEFFTDKETLDMARFENLGVIKNEALYQPELLALFEQRIGEMKQSREWNKEQIVELFFEMIPDFGHKETGKYLDSKM